ncbi:hypothetical protein GGI12_005554, partial [Dipsacomyces acuminosporus]
MDEPIELLSDADAETNKASAGTTVHSRKMRVRMGLPAGFFVHDRDDDFYKWDALYPAVEREDVVQRINCQLGREEEVEKLVDILMGGANSLRRYPSGMPPPAAIKPILPPMKTNAKP